MYSQRYGRPSQALKNMEDKEKAEQCAEELDELLKKYNCTIIVQKQEFYGQIVYAPVIAEIKKTS